MRVKIIEGMAAGKTIISTHIGAEGIGCKHQKNIILADKPEEMASWILTCAGNTKMANGISREARIFAKEHYNSNRIMDNLLAFYSKFYPN
jgi:glycosyltransferase involved in cell wall biosynthesis